MGSRIARRLAQSRVWVEKYAPENRVKLLESLPDQVMSQLDPNDRQALRLFAARATAATLAPSAADLRDAVGTVGARGSPGCP